MALRFSCRTNNLDISTLSGAGTYRVYVNIGGVRITVSPAQFDLL
jgi:hypothetical protein